MSIKMSIEPLQTSQERLQFGIPLEDVLHTKFEVHSAFQRLLREAYDYVVSSGYSVTKVISLQGALRERLALKEAVTCLYAKDLPKIQCSPGAFLWIIRHYLGLLPVQIVPKHIGNVKFVWWKIGKHCEKNLRTGYCSRSNNDTELTYKVINELLRLPLPNFRLVMSVLNFLRMLAVLPTGEPAVKKKSLFALVKYFAPCIFIRPFRPGTRTKNDPQYYSLLLYLVLKWPDILTVLETKSYSLYLPQEKFKTVSPSTSKIRATQTRGSILRVIPEWYDACEFLRDSWCQTDFYQEEVLQHTQKANKQMSCCCCVLRRNDKKAYTKVACGNDSDESEFSDHAEFLYDEYSRCNLVGDNYEIVKDFDPYSKISTPTKSDVQNKLSLDIQEAINKELKEKFALTSNEILKPNDFDVDNDSISETNTNTSEKVPSEIIDSNKSLVSVKKIRSKLEFLRVFKSGAKPAKTYNFETVKSEIKYQKI